MRRFYDTELEAFRSKLILMSEKAIEQLHHAYKALVSSDTVLARQIVRADDGIDQLEIAIDDEAMSYMNLRAPIASDLRLIVVGMKTSHDLERVGDEAQSIAMRILRMEKESLVAAPQKLSRLEPVRQALGSMAMIAEAMLRDAIDCLFEADNKEKAGAVIRRDDEVDQMNRQIYDELSLIMNEEPSIIPCALELTFISKSIERMADHATNIAEEMFYLTEARDIRHTGEVRKDA
jgi:phosphate transport system protein